MNLAAQTVIVQSLRVLVIEDDVDHARLIQRQLDKTRVAESVTVVESLDEARVQLQRHQSDLIILDLNLPGATIDETLSSTLAWAAGAPVIVLTALDDIELGVRAINEGAQDYLVKQEMTAGALARSVHSALERARSQEQLHRLTAQLQRVNHELADFSALVAHDLRSPVARMNWYVEMLEADEHSQLSEEARRCLRAIRGQADRISRLVTDLWTYSSQNDEDQARERIVCSEMVEDIFAMLDRPDGFRLQNAAQDVVLYAHRTVIEVVLRNLVTNAIKHHNRDDGWVRVSCARSGDWVQFQVRDDGPGLPPEVCQALEEADEPQARGADSPLGLGLTIVKRILARYDAPWRLDSTPSGALFEFQWRESDPTS